MGTDEPRRFPTSWDKTATGAGKRTGRTLIGKVGAEETARERELQGLGMREDEAICRKTRQQELRERPQTLCPHPPSEWRFLYVWIEGQPGVRSQFTPVPPDSLQHCWNKLPSLWGWGSPVPQHMSCAHGTQACMHSQVDTQLRDIPPPPSQLAHPHTSCPELGVLGENAGYGSDIHQVGGSSGSRSLEGMWGPRPWFLREKAKEGK